MSIPCCAQGDDCRFLDRVHTYQSPCHLRVTARVAESKEGETDGDLETRERTNGRHYGLYERHLQVFLVVLFRHRVHVPAQSVEGGDDVHGHCANGAGLLPTS